MGFDFLLIVEITFTPLGVRVYVWKEWGGEGLLKEDIFELEKLFLLFVFLSTHLAFCEAEALVQMCPSPIMF